MKLRRVNKYITIDADNNGIVKRCTSCQRWKPARLEYYPLRNLYYAPECRECTAKQRVRDERLEAVR